MKNFAVKQFVFGNGNFRTVEIDSAGFDKLSVNEKLNMIYMYGQNDFQPKSTPSVSVGDVIFFDDDKYIVKRMGFEKIKDTMFRKLNKSLNDSNGSSREYRNILYNMMGDKSFEYC